MWVPDFGMLTRTEPEQAACESVWVILISREKERRGGGGAVPGFSSGHLPVAAEVVAR